MLLHPNLALLSPIHLQPSNCCSQADAEAAQVAKSQRKTASVPEPKRRKTTTTCCGCLFNIKVSVASKSQSEKLGVTVGSVRIMSAHYFHSNGCLPSLHQFVDQKKRLGLYNRPLNQHQLGHLITLVGNNEKVPAIMMRNASYVAIIS